MQRMSEESPGTTADLTRRRERMHKPHVQQPAVNSKYVVNLAGHCIFFRVHRQFVSNRKKASSLARFLSGAEETPFFHFVSDYFRSASSCFVTGYTLVVIPLNLQTSKCIETSVWTMNKKLLFIICHALK